MDTSIPIVSAYPWWTFADREVLLELLDRLRPATVLEFGPGVSTLTLVEWGVPWIDTFEDTEAWYDTSRRIFATLPQVHLHLYQRRDPLYLPQVHVPTYDLAFVDGPQNKLERGPELTYACAHSRAVIFHDAASTAMREIALKVLRPEWLIEEIVTDLATRESDGEELVYSMALVTGM